jgi:hypothetical protein
MEQECQPFDFNPQSDARENVKYLIMGISKEQVCNQKPAYLVLRGTQGCFSQQIAI